MLLALSNLSLLTVGFSTWVTESVSASSRLQGPNVTVGQVKENKTIDKGIYYVFGSEYAFDYFALVNDTKTDYVCTKPRLGFQVKICPSELEDAISQSSLNKLMIDINVSYQTEDDFDMFSPSNPNTNPPSAFVFSLNEQPEYTYFSESIDTSYASGYGSLSAKVLLYEPDENDLLEFTKVFSLNSDSQFTFYDVYLPFELKDTFDYDAYQKLTFSYSVSLKTMRA